MENKNRIDTWSDMDELICPYCGYKHKLDHTEWLGGYADEMEFDGAPFTCPNCGREYKVTRCVSFTYETFPAETKLRFYKADGKWYADVAGRTRNENEMVFGADTALEMISGRSESVTLTMDTVEPSAYLLRLSLKEHDCEGATYSITGSKYNQMMEAMAEGAIMPFSEVWLCNVVHDVFGKHPQDIYITAIE